MSLSLLPYDLHHYLLFSIADTAPLPTLLAISSVNKTFYHLFRENKTSLICAVVEAEVGSFFPLALELASRELSQEQRLASHDSNKIGEDPEYEFRLLCRARSVHAKVITFAKYLQHLSKTTVNFLCWQHDRKRGQWINSVYMFAIRGPSNMRYPISHQKSRLLHITSWIELAEYAIENLEEDLETSLAVPKGKRMALTRRLRHWLLMWGYEGSKLGSTGANNACAWRVLGDLLGIWDGAGDMVKKLIPEAHWRRHMFEPHAVTFGGIEGALPTEKEKKEWHKWLEGTREKRIATLKSWAISNPSNET